MKEKNYNIPYITSKILKYEKTKKNEIKYIKKDYIRSKILSKL